MEFASELNFQCVLASDAYTHELCSKFSPKNFYHLLFFWQQTKQEIHSRVHARLRSISCIFLLHLFLHLAFFVQAPPVSHVIYTVEFRAATQNCFILLSDSLQNGSISFLIESTLFVWLVHTGCNKV